MGPIAALVAALAVLGCTVDGEAVAGSPDLSSKSVSPDDFPGGSATQVPTAAVPAALADLTGHPLHGTVVPPDCLPAAVSADGAVVLVGADPATSTATFTSAVVDSSQTLRELTDQARRCPRYVVGSAPTAFSTVTTEVRDAPQQPRVSTAALTRLIATGGLDTSGSSSLSTSTTTLLAQRNDLRVIVEYRHQGAGPMSATATEQLDELFDKAVEAAFP
ncbi:hypothetical protein [Gordonia rhizosphera]|uniref:DUF5642 domain-containing protein n=1 Tax=Gordonia rhizosphera NBRC 16068 TaxID=1108045 RepID=K6UY41_9ACTN|nr:hypothetical protein [Gordonia rhizosphera]GAB88298.1 hypothetical protein GORHZ_013_00010 [Gordonia rhizosphera NBRC 16068]